MNLEVFTETWQQENQLLAICVEISTAEAKLWDYKLNKALWYAPAAIEKYIIPWTSSLLKPEPKLVSWHRPTFYRNKYTNGEWTTGVIWRRDIESWSKVKYENFEALGWETRELPE